MKANTCLPNARGLTALLFSAFLLTSVGAEPVRPDAGKRPPANLKLDQVDSATGTKRTVAPGKIEYPNARTKSGDAAKWEGPDLDASKSPRMKNTRKTGVTNRSDAIKIDPIPADRYADKSTQKQTGGTADGGKRADGLVTEVGFPKAKSTASPANAGPRGASNCYREGGVNDTTHRRARATGC
jgi:hypothetical protein